MTGITATFLTCDRQTRPAVDGMVTICGTQFGPTESSIDHTRWLARQYGWKYAGQHDYCVRHHQPIRFDEGGPDAQG